MEAIQKKIKDDFVVACRLSVQGSEFIKNFANPGRGASFCIDAVMVLYNFGLQDLRKYFTFQELSFFLNIMNGVSFHGIYLGCQLLSILENSLSDGIPAKWGVNFDDLLGKIKMLNKFQLSVLELYCRFFWESNFCEQENAVDRWIEISNK